MTDADPVAIALQFVDCINNKDIESLAALMAEDICMIPPDGEPETGRLRLRQGFKSYLEDFPAYQIHIEKITRSLGRVALIGRTTGSHIPPEVEAGETVVFVARIENQQVAAWHIYSDMDQIHEREAIPGKQRDPKLTALLYNDCINRQDLAGLAALMTEDFVFIDRKGEADRGKAAMMTGWEGFFQSFPDYYNTFERVRSEGNTVILYGYGTWRRGGDPDYAIWVAQIEGDQVIEWRIYVDTEENRERFNLV
jgi:ketosteroid isomerase-like protein